MHLCIFRQDWCPVDLDFPVTHKQNVSCLTLKQRKGSVLRVIFRKRMYLRFFLHDNKEKEEINCNKMCIFPYLNSLFRLCCYSRLISSIILKIFKVQCNLLSASSVIFWFICTAVREICLYFTCFWIELYRKVEIQIIILSHYCKKWTLLTPTDNTLSGLALMWRTSSKPTLKTNNYVNKIKVILNVLTCDLSKQEILGNFYTRNASFLH